MGFNFQQETTTMTTNEQDLQNHLERYAKRHMELANQLLKANPGMHIIAAMIQATDMSSAEDMAAMVERGERKAEDLVWRVGSYCRLDWAIEFCKDDFVLDNLAELWVGSDP